MKLSLVLISSYKSWQGNKDICTLLYFHKRLARKKNLRRVISFFFPLPCLVLSVRGLTQHLLPPRAERKAVWHGATPHLLRRSGHVLGCPHKPFPQRWAMVTVSRAGNSSAGEAFRRALWFPHPCRWLGAMPHRPAVLI